jgi:hypothetical protein
MVQRRFALTATTGITPTHARRMDTMGRIILPAAFLSAPGPGSMVSMGLASTVATGIGIVDSAVVATFAATGDSAVIADFMAIADSMGEASSMAVTHFTAAEVEDSMAAVAVHMVVVASTEVAEVTEVAVVNRG